MQFCGERVREARAAQRITQAQLAGAVGVSVDTIRRAEAGRFDPRAETIGRIAQALGLSVADLFAKDSAA